MHANHTTEAEPVNAPTPPFVVLPIGSGPDLRYEVVSTRVPDWRWDAGAVVSEHRDEGEAYAYCDRLNAGCVLDDEPTLDDLAWRDEHPADPEWWAGLDADASWWDRYESTVVADHLRPRARSLRVDAAEEHRQYGR